MSPHSCSSPGFGEGVPTFQPPILSVQTLETVSARIAPKSLSPRHCWKLSETVSGTSTHGLLRGGGNRNPLAPLQARPQLMYPNVPRCVPCPWNALQHFNNHSDFTSTVVGIQQGTPLTRPDTRDTGGRCLGSCRRLHSELISAVEHVVLMLHAASRLLTGQASCARKVRFVSESPWKSGLTSDWRDTDVYRGDKRPLSGV